MHFVHNSSYADEGSIIGEGTKIWHFCHIQKNARIGSNCVLGQNIYIGSGVIIGNNVKIQNNVTIPNGVVIEDDVFIGPTVMFTNVINPRAFIERKNEFKTTLIKKGASIGANSSIICGNNIGKYSFIGAGSVVTKSINDYSIFYGVPAKRKGWICECGNKLKKAKRKIWNCDKCKKRYKYLNKNIFEIKEKKNDS